MPSVLALAAIDWNEGVKLISLSTFSLDLWSSESSTTFLYSLGLVCPHFRSCLCYNLESL